MPVKTKESEVLAHSPTGPLTHFHQELIEVHPLPIRIFHWVMVFTITTLVFTGMYIHYPGLLNIPFSTVKTIKGVSNFILIANTALYVYYSLITKHYCELIFRLKDVHFLPNFFRYFLFLKDNPGYYGKYNPGQKATYTLWFLLILIQIFTGLILFFPDIFAFLIPKLGGLNKIRMVHYLVTWIFVATIPLHVYLALTEDPAKLQSIFTGWARR